MIQIDEILPSSPIESEVVLHVRLHLRRTIRGKDPSAAQALAMLFGFPWSSGASPKWREAAAAPAPLLAGAELAARLRNEDGSGVVALGHDAQHLAECKAWLLKRKESDDAFEKIVATDLATLLELSKARDLAIAMGQDEQGKPRPLPILIQGETGTGKELLAKGIHTLWTRASGRPKAPFQFVHVAGMTDDLINDELFGHVKGAYTGADSERIGRIEAADTGTLLIDEVGDLPQSAQLRLLRFLQTQQMSRVGENKDRHIQVRIIAATWHDLEKLVEQGRFRRDLFHRLRFGSSLVLPPLADRENFIREVVPSLLEHRGHKVEPLLTRSAQEALELHKWPGNLRELVGVLEEALSLACGGTLRLEHLPAHIQRAYLARPLYERAVGFLSDAIEGQDLTEAHVRWRVEQVEHAIRGMGQMPAHPELAALSKFLSSPDEQSPEHQLVMKGVADWINLGQEQQWQSALAGVWAELAGAAVPEVVEHVLRARSSHAQGQVNELQRQQRELESKVRAQLAQHPWMMLINELRGLPIVQQLERESGDMSGLMVFLLNLLKSFAPPAVDKLRNEVKKGGFIKRLIDQSARTVPVEAGDSNKQDESGKTQKKPGDMSAEEWEALTKNHETQADAQRATGYDPKTIAKYLEKFGLTNPWARNTPD